MSKGGGFGEQDLALLYETYGTVLPATHRVCVNDIGADKVPESMVYKYFESKNSKFGWKCYYPQTEEEVAFILDLRQRV